MTITEFVTTSMQSVDEKEEVAIIIKQFYKSHKLRKFYRKFYNKSDY